MSEDAETALADALLMVMLPHEVQTRVNGVSFSSATANDHMARLRQELTNEIVGFAKNSVQRLLHFVEQQEEAEAQIQTEPEPTSSSTTADTPRKSSLCKTDSSLPRDRSKSVSFNLARVLVEYTPETRTPESQTPESQTPDSQTPPSPEDSINQQMARSIANLDIGQDTDDDNVRQVENRNISGSDDFDIIDRSEVENDSEGEADSSVDADKDATEMFSFDDQDSALTPSLSTSLPINIPSPAMRPARRLVEQPSDMVPAEKDREKDTVSSTELLRATEQAFGRDDGSYVFSYRGHSMSSINTLDPSRLSFTQRIMWESSKETGSITGGEVLVDRVDPDLYSS